MSDSEENLPRRSTGIALGRLSDTAPVRAVRSEERPVQLITAERFKEQIEDLRRSTTIKNDKGEEVSFEGETKEEFIGLFMEGYPVAEKLLETIHDTGRFLYEVREILKPKGLFLRWMELTGFRDRRYYRYLRVYGSFRDDLSRFSHLGIRKLEAASRLKNCVEYLENNAEDAEKQTVKEFEQTVRNLRTGKKKGSKAKPPKFDEIAGYKVSRTQDGKRMVVEGLSRKKQNELFEAIKALLLKTNLAT
ncbi:MAG: hypothetical protein V2B18_10450 [Pseudomonadota bacterium]